MVSNQAIRGIKKIRISRDPNMVSCNDPPHDIKESASETRPLWNGKKSRYFEEIYIFKSLWTSRFPKNYFFGFLKPYLFIVVKKTSTSRRLKKEGDQNFWGILWFYSFSKNILLILRGNLDEVNLMTKNISFGIIRLSSQIGWLFENILRNRKLLEIQE